MSCGRSVLEHVGALKLLTSVGEVLGSINWSVNRLCVWIFLGFVHSLKTRARLVRVTYVRNCLLVNMLSIVTDRS